MPGWHLPVAETTALSITRHHKNNVRCFRSLNTRTDSSFILMHKGFVETLCSACNAFECTTTCMLINSTLFFYRHCKRRMFWFPSCISSKLNSCKVWCCWRWENKARSAYDKSVLLLCGWCGLTLTWDVLCQSYCPVGSVPFHPHNTWSFCTKNKELRCFGTMDPLWTAKIQHVLTKTIRNFIESSKVSM